LHLDKYLCRNNGERRENNQKVFSKATKRVGTKWGGRTSELIPSPYSGLFDIKGNARTRQQYNGWVSINKTRK
jgi:hypothetical protein